MQNKYKYYENIRNEHEILKKRIFNLSIMLQSAKNKFEDKIRIKYAYDRRKYITFIKNGNLCLKANSNYVNHSLKYSYCMQSGHLKNYCYVKNNEKLG